MTKLENKTALVTGASRGIGRAIASALAEGGARVLVHYGRSDQEARSLVAAIQTKGGSAAAISADLGIPNGAAMLAEKVRSIVGDRLDVLVCNPESARRRPSRITRCRILTTSLRQTSEAHSSWFSNFSLFSVRAQTSLLSPPS